MRTSTFLSVGEHYSRKQLTAKFSIVDQTINTGIFVPKGHESIWVFITVQKRPGMTDYADRLDGDTLFMEGQTKHRTDKHLIEHKRDGREVVVFYREKKDERPDYSFRFEGVFRYVLHKPGGEGQPSSFVLKRVKASTDELAATTEALQEKGAFDAADDQDARARILSAIAVRRGQAQFRAALVAAYHGRCAISGCDADAALEAAHIRPYRGKHTHHVQNGILLRADLHTLFDRGLITINPETLKVEVAPQLISTVYKEIAGRTITRPDAAGERPDKDALRWHQEQSRAG